MAKNEQFRDVITERIPVTNVLAFDVEGDGNNDDAAGLQDAIDYAEQNGGVVYFPPGTYNVSNTLTVNSNITIVGDGKGSSTIVGNAVLEKVIELNAGAVVRDLTVDCQNNVNKGVVFYNANSPQVESVEVKNCNSSSTFTQSSIGILAKGSSNAVIQNCTVTDVNNDHSLVSTGIATVGGTDGGGHRISNNYVDTITPGDDGDCIKSGPDGGGVVIEGNVCIDGQKRAIKCQSKDSTVNDNVCYWTGNGAPINAIAIQHDNCSVVGNVISSVAYDYSGIHQGQGNKNCTIVGNSIEIRGTSNSGDMMQLRQENSAVIGNALYMNGEGRYGISVPDQIDNLIIGQNTIEQAGTSGIRFWADNVCNRVIVNHNIINNAGVYGIDLSNVNNIDIKDNIMSAGTARINNRDGVVINDAGQAVLKVSKAGGQTAGSGGSTKLTLGNKLVDRGKNAIDLNGGNDSISILEDGTYNINCQVMLDGPSNSTRFQVRVRLNGNNKIMWPDTVSQGGAAETLNPETTKNLNAGDEISFAVYHDDSNGGLGIMSNPPKTQFTVTKVA